MEAKLTLYDILAIVVPGGLLIIVILSLAWSLGVEMPEQIAQSLTGTIAFLILTYFVGHIIQAFGKWYETRILVKRWGGKPSIRFICDLDGHYSTEFKSGIFKSLKNKFGLSLIKDEVDYIITDKHRNEAFQLCYSYISERNLASMASLMNTTYGLFRGLVITCALCSLLFFGGAAILYFEGLVTNTITSSIIGLIFFGLAVLFDRRLKQRGELFADKVYQSFLASIKIEEGEFE